MDTIEAPTRVNGYLEELLQRHHQGDTAAEVQAPAPPDAVEIDASLEDVMIEYGLAKARMTPEAWRYAKTNLTRPHYTVHVAKLDWENPEDVKRLEELWSQSLNGKILMLGDPIDRFNEKTGKLITYFRWADVEIRVKDGVREKERS